MSESSPRPIAVLHVDDEPGLAEMVATSLERQSDRIDVHTETSADDALESVELADVDCVVSDFQMPGTNGIEFLEVVRERCPNLPFILYTGKGSEAVASEAISAGATDYLQKGTGPSQYELLANRIVHAVDSRRAEQRATTFEETRALLRQARHALVRATTRSEIEARVVETLASADRYAAAWIGRVDGDRTRLEPTATSGIEDAAIATGDGLPGLVATALADDRITLIDDLSTADTGELTVDDGRLRSTAVVPLTYEDDACGVLFVHDDEPGTLTGVDRDLLRELGADLAHAIDAAAMRKALRRERDRRGALFENALNSMVEFTVEDGTPVIRAVNPAFEETFGYEAAAVVGRPVGDVLVAGEQRESYEAIVDDVVAGEFVQREVRRQTVDGPQDFLLTVATFDIDGVKGGYAWHVDITDQKEALAEYRDKAIVFDQLIKQLPVSLYVKDREGRHLHKSHFDTTPEEVLGKTDPEIYGDEEFARAAYEDDMHVVETGEPIINQEEYNEDNGEWMLTSKVPWYGEDGTVNGLIGVTRLITEKKEYEQELHRQNERLDRFASVLSHDLRNPLNVAYGHLDAAQRECEEDSLDQVQTALDRIDALIENVLALARKGQAALEPEWVGLVSVAERAWNNTRTGETTLEFEDDLTVCADEPRFIELFENLFVNAHVHGGPDTVTVGVLSDEAGIYVADDGNGIPPEDREEVFWPGHTTAEDGTGFGLAIVSEIVEGHGWEIDVTESADGGARFEITGIQSR